MTRHLATFISYPPAACSGTTTWHHLGGGTNHRFGRMSSLRPVITLSGGISVYLKQHSFFFNKSATNPLPRVTGPGGLCPPSAHGITTHLSNNEAGSTVPVGFAQKKTFPRAHPNHRTKDPWLIKGRPCVSACQPLGKRD